MNAGSFTVSGGELQWDETGRLGTGAINVTGNATIRSTKTTDPAYMSNSGITVSDGVTLNIYQQNPNNKGSSAATLAPIHGGSVGSPITLNLYHTVTAGRYRLSASDFTGNVYLRNRSIYENLNDNQFGNAANRLYIVGGLETYSTTTISRPVTIQGGYLGGSGSAVITFAGTVTNTGSPVTTGTVRFTNPLNSLGAWYPNGGSIEFTYLPTSGGSRSDAGGGSGVAFRWIGDLVGNASFGITKNYDFSDGLAASRWLYLDVPSNGANVTLTQAVSGYQAGRGGFQKNGAGQLNLSAAGSSFGALKVNAGTLNANNNLTGMGDITIASGATFGVGGASGRLESGSYSGLITNNGRFVYSSSQNQTLSGIIRGSGSLTKSGTGALTLGAVNEYTGATLVNGGTLTVSQYNGLANNGSDKVTISAFNAVGRTNFTGAATLRRAITASSNFVGYGSSLTGGTVATAANILQGRNNSGSTATLQMQWRPKVTADSVTGQMSPISDVLNLSGIDTQPFTLQMSYTDDGFDRFGPAGLLYLGWFNTNTLSWVNAVAGNHAAGTTVITDYLGSWSNFSNQYSVADANLNLYLGSWGVDTNANMVWAVLDHNSQFAVLSIPEPAVFAFLLAGGWIFVCVRRRGR